MRRNDSLFPILNTNKRPYENSSDISACRLTKATGDDSKPAWLRELSFNSSEACGRVSVAKNAK